jgi:hypothetical protein
LIRRGLRVRGACAILPAMDRRNFLHLMAGLPLLAATSDLALAAKGASIERLIADARGLPRISERIDLISRRFLGVRYQRNTMIGSMTRPEQFIIRDDVFDCVTLCEVVLAAAIARDLSEFETVLRRIRYDGGVVQYDKRNHYWADWCKRNVDNGICKPVTIEPSVTVDKTVTWHREFGRHPVSFVAIDTATMLANKERLVTGDIIGFVSRRASLDYYHTGFIAFGKGGELMLRSASLSRGRVLDEPMTGFIAANAVKHVSLLRAAESRSIVERR